MTDKPQAIEGEILDAETVDESTGVDLIVAMPEGTSSIVDIFQKDKIDDLTKRIREESERLKKEGEFNLDTKEGRAAIKSFARKVASAKNRLQETGTAMTKDLRDKVKAINEQRDGAVTTLQKLQDEVREPLTKWEETDNARKAAHEVAIKEITDLAHDFTYMSAPGEIEAVITDLIHKDTGDRFEEFEGKATKAKSDTIEALNVILEQANVRVEQERAKAEAEKIAREAQEAKEKAEAEARQIREEAELLKRQAQEEKEKAEREIQQAKEEAERAKREAQEAKEQAERDRKEAAEKAERDRKEAAEKAERDRLQAIQDEKDRQAREERAAEEKAQLEKEQAERIEREKEQAAQEAKEKAEREQREKEEKERREREQREADELRRTGILSDITEALKPLKKADIAQALMDGEIPHVSINF